MSIYLDNSATTKPFFETVEAVRYGMEEAYYNPSTLYRPSVAIKRDMEKVRQSISAYLMVQSDEIYFTSGGTESNNIPLLGAVRSLSEDCHLIANRSEHSSVHEVFWYLREEAGLSVEYLLNDAHGCLTLESLEERMRPDTDIVSVMHVNNETGAVNDINALAKLAKRINPHCFFHSDGVQAFLKTDIPDCFYIDSYSISGHKFHGPRGCGAFYLKRGSRVRPILFGGGQEGNLRSGTENVPAILGMGAAIERYRNNHETYVAHMRKVKIRLAEGLLALSGVRVNGPHYRNGAPHILSIGFEGIYAETLVNALSEEDIYVGIGSACSSKSPGKTRPLKAMGLPEDIQQGTIRFSFCYENTLQEVDQVIETIGWILPQLRRFKRR